MDSLSLRHEVEDLYYDYAESLDQGEFERWPEFFVDDCLYRIVSRENFDRGLPLATMLCESAGMLKDRVVAIRQTLMFAPRMMRHLVSNIRIRSQEAGTIRAGANFLVLETLDDDESRIFSTGRYIDVIVKQSERVRFKERTCVFDTVTVANSLIFPI